MEQEEEEEDQEQEEEEEGQEQEEEEEPAEALELSPVEHLGLGFHWEMEHTWREPQFIRIVVACPPPGAACRPCVVS